MNRTKKAVRAIAAAGLMAGLLTGAFFALKISHALRIARQEVRSQNQIRFLDRPFSPPASSPFEVVSAPAEFGRAATFQNHLFIAGPEGLLEYEKSGTLLRQFSVGKDLPSSPLVDLTSTVLADSREPELVLATAQDGLLAYNGRSFRQIYPEESNSREITCVIVGENGHLLIGTKKRGVLVFDGKTITALHPTLAKVYVTALAGDESDLWVGTLDRGVLHWHAGETEAFGEAQGMPDPQVLSLELAGDRTYVGTPVGVAVFERGRFSRVIERGVFATALLATPQRIVIGTEDEGVLTIPQKTSRRDTPLHRTTAAREVRQLFALGDQIYVLTRRDVFRMNAQGLGWELVLQSGPAMLTDRNISALAADSNGRLWVGYFDRGLDELDMATGRVTHVENEHVFCVNRILPKANDATVDVATANGLVRFGASGNEEQVLTRADGLIADHVTDVAAYRDGLALATPAGLTFLDRSGARSLYAFQGLVNNHVFTLGVSGNELLAGTLGGLSVIGHEVVQTNYTVGNSNLKHNWITAVVPVGEEWMVGTYGAGVLALDSAGRFRSFDKATGPFEVNSNAMLVTERYVFAGTLGNGLFVYDRASGRWSVITEGLPSENVTALAENGGYVYVGTDNGLARIEERKLQP
jgi:ligand-binding sensor domain-containing protein